jgi:predicted phosphodiesterase
MSGYMADKFSWLHLSDIHHGMSGQVDKQLEAYQELLEHVRVYAAKYGEPDCVFVTGDLVQSGKRNEYREVTEKLFKPLKEIFGTDWHGNILAVPGNHDLDRSAIDAEAYVRAPYLKALDILTLEHASRKVKERRKLLSRAFRSYSEWDQDHCRDTDTDHWLLRGVHVSQPVCDKPWLWVVRLNTAWVAWGEDGNAELDEKGLCCGRVIATQALRSVPDDATCIVLGHHPLEWLEEECRKDVEACFGVRGAVYLHGHLHTIDAKRGNRFQDYIALQGGATYQAYNDNKEPNSVVWGEIDNTTNTLRLRTYVWKDRSWKRAETVTGFEELNGWDMRALPKRTNGGKSTIKLVDCGSSLVVPALNTPTQLATVVSLSPKKQLGPASKVIPFAVPINEGNTGEIVWLKSKAATDAKRFGAKAASLAVLLAKSFPVPDGFCLDADFLRRLATPGKKDGAENDLLEAFQKLMRTSSSGFVIARSSSSVEDDPKHLFPGQFASQSKIRTYDQLVGAIQTCVASASAPNVQEYAKALGVDYNSIKMSVLIQEEIVSPVSGVAFTKAPLPGYAKQDGVYIECSLGNTNPADLDHPTYAYFVRGNGSIQTQVDVDRVSVADLVHPSGNHARIELLRNVALLAKRVKFEEGSDRDIEWVADRNQNPILVQARPLASRSPLSSIIGHNKHENTLENRVLKKPLFTEEAEIGLKAAAMKYFVENGLFTPATLFIQPYEPVKRVREQVLEMNFGNRGITVRFSHSTDIGLPREFMKSNADALDWYFANRKPEWMGILYGYMDVRHSFELYLDNAWWVVEHVPGIWESNSKLEPDVIISTVEEDLYLRSTATVEAFYKDPSGTHHDETSPCVAQSLFHWQSKLSPIIERLRERFKDALPINFHFVEDDNSNWHFLNIRDVGQLSKTFEYRENRRGYYHVVSTKNDLSRWDGRKPILLQLTTARGAERDLHQLLEHLPKNQDQIYISFGLLSHPAIVLREYGLKPVPLYSTHEIIRRTKGG